MQHILNRELELIRTVNTGIEAIAPITRHFDPPSYLGHDQRRALTPNCSPAASPIHTNAKLPLNCKPCAMTWLNSVSFRLNGGRKKPPRQRWRIFAP